MASWKGQVEFVSEVLARGAPINASSSSLNHVASGVTRLVTDVVDLSAASTPARFLTDMDLTKLYMRS